MSSSEATLGWDWSIPYTLFSISEFGDHGDFFFPAIDQGGRFKPEADERIVAELSGVDLGFFTRVVSNSPVMKDWTLTDATVSITDRRIAWTASVPGPSTHFRNHGAPISAAVLNALIRSHHNARTRDLVACGHLRWDWVRNVSIAASTVQLHSMRPNACGSSSLTLTSPPDWDLEKVARTCLQAGINFQSKLPWLDNKWIAYFANTPISIEKGQLGPTLMGFRWLGSVGKQLDTEDAESQDAKDRHVILNSLCWAPVGAPGMSRLMAVDTKISSEKLLSIVDESTQGHTVQFRIGGGGRLTAVKVAVSQRAENGYTCTFSSVTGNHILGIACAIIPLRGCLLVYMDHATSSRTMSGWIPVGPEWSSCEQRFKTFLEDISAGIKKLNAEASVLIQDLWT